MEIKGKTAIVTGGASGIGRGTCEELVKRGGRVVIFDMQEEAGLATVEELGKDHAHFARIDVSDAEQVQAGVDEAIQRFGGIHIVLNSAGVPLTAKTVSNDGTPFPLETWNRVVAVNLTGTFNVARLCAAAMLRNEPEGESGERGVIVNVSSGAAWQGQMGQVAYSATKAGVIGMVLPMARDLGKHGIRVLAVAPGLFDTQMVAGLPDKVKDALQRLPIFPKRMGRPSELGALVCTMVEVEYFNAECISLDAGTRMT